MSPPGARAPREANLTPGAAQGSQAGLRPHRTPPALAEMKDLTSHPIRNQAPVVEERKAPEARSSRAGSLLCYRLTGGAWGDLTWSRAPGRRSGGTERHIASVSKGFCAHHSQVPALHQHQPRPLGSFGHSSPGVTCPRHAWAKPTSSPAHIHIDCTQQEPRAQHPEPRRASTRRERMGVAPAPLTAMSCSAALRGILGAQGGRRAGASLVTLALAAEGRRVDPRRSHLSGS